MPAIASGKVLVTGANGYIAIWVVKSFLDQGFLVRGTVRSESKATHLREYFKSAGDKLEIVVVEDITQDGAFDAAVDGVDAIAHTASPFHFKAVDPQEMIGPAVQGTLSILKSAQKYGAAVKRVVVLSSTAALYQASANPVVLNESNWNEGEIEECKTKGKNASQMAKYRASKTLAEQAAWKFYKENKSTLPWELTVLNPPYVFGPNIHEVTKLENVGESMALWYGNVIFGKSDNNALATTGACYVDVRDIAFAHVLAITKPEAGGERLVITPGAFKWQDFVSAAHRWSNKLPAGNESYDPAKAVHQIQYDNSKAQKVLGLKFRGVDEITRDSLEDIKARGWL